MSNHLDSQAYRSNSASNSHLIDHDNELTPYASAEEPKSRRASVDTSCVVPASSSKTDFDHGKKAQKQPEAGSGERFRSEVNHPDHGMADPDHPLAYTSSARIQVPPATPGRTIVYSGRSEKAFEFDTATLTAKSVYWKRFLGSNIPQDPAQYRSACTFREPEEMSMALFGKWLYGEKLNGPSDFHTMQHYLGLYVLARLWECETLQNEVMDLVRNYYATEHNTASPYRLEYIYTYTSAPNPMRRFMVSSAAFRALTEGGPEVPGSSLSSDPNYLSTSMQNVLTANLPLATDYISALIHLHHADMPDARHGSACVWHEHNTTKKCQERPREVWEEQ